MSAQPRTWNGKRCQHCNAQLTGKQEKNCAACKPPASVFRPSLKGAFNEIDEVHADDDVEGCDMEEY